MKMIFRLFLLMLLSVSAHAAPLTLVTTVKSVATVARPGYDWGGLSIRVAEPITGTACAAADLAKGFYFTTLAEPRALAWAQMQQSVAMVAGALGATVRVTYDSASTCYSGYGVGFVGIEVLYP